MDRKAIAMLFGLLLFAPYCSGQFYIIEGNEIEIDVDAKGNTQVNERFFLSFQNEEQLAGFRESVAEIGVSLAGWKAYDGRLFPHVGQEKDWVVSGISFNEKDRKYLEMNYSLVDPLMEKQSETSRVIFYKINTKFFNWFEQGSLWVIPEGTTITINLPKGAEVETPVKPDARLEGNSVVWEGYVFGNEMTLNYRMFKQIASFDLNEVLQQLMKSDLFWIFVAVAAVFAFIILVKRKKISGRIEGYIVERSDLGIEEEQE